MKNVAYLCLSIFLLCAAIAAIMIARSAALLRLDVNTQLSILQTKTDWEMGAINGQLTKLNATLDKTRKDLRAESAEYRALIDQDWARTVQVMAKIANDQLSVTNATVEEALGSTNEILAQTAGVALTQAKPTMDNLADISASVNTLAFRINEQEPMMYSRYLAVSGELMKTLDALRLTSNEIAKSAPELTVNVTDMTRNVADITHDVREYTKPKGFLRGVLVPLVVSATHFIF